MIKGKEDVAHEYVPLLCSTQVGSQSVSIYCEPLWDKVAGLMKGDI